jgi:hypothetical protein
MGIGSDGSRRWRGCGEGDGDGVGEARAVGDPGAGDVAPAGLEEHELEINTLTRPIAKRCRFHTVSG